jgi:MFS family permease
MLPPYNRALYKSQTDCSDAFFSSTSTLITSYFLCQQPLLPCVTMGKFGLGAVTESWRMFSPEEKRNIAIYILGIMLYKFGLEAFNGSIVALATNRYDFDAWRNDTDSRTFERVGLLTGLNQAFQCVGSILIAPLIKRFPTKNVLACAILIFGVMASLLLIVDAGTGGRFKPSDWEDTHPDEDDFGYYGSYNTNGMIPIYCVSGITYGMVELIRRVIPRDIVGGNVQKLRRMDALVHIFYEVAGTGTESLLLLPLGLG